MPSVRDIVAVDIDGEATLKTYKTINGKIALMPENDNYEPIIIEDQEFRFLGVAIGLIKNSSVIDSYVVRQPKAYPVYDQNYKMNVDTIREALKNYPGLYLVGRNGMHKYNNQDHSMLTAITAVDNIISGKKSKENIWNINTEEEYHEEK